MKTRKLLFTMIAAMTMMFGLTLTVNAEEAAPATKVVGVEGIGTFTVPADWTEEYIEGYGTYWFNPAKTACVAMDTTTPTSENPPIEVFAPIYKKNIEATGVTIIDWQVTKYFGHDAIYAVALCPGNTDFPMDYQVLNTISYSCGYDYYSGNCIAGNNVGATTIEELQTVLPILATYQPAQ